jgi:hypothetical protein
MPLASKQAQSAWLAAWVVHLGLDLVVQGQIRTFTRYGIGLVCAGHEYARLVAYLALFGEIRLVLDVHLAQIGRGAFGSRSRRPSPNKKFYSVW